MSSVPLVFSKTGEKTEKSSCRRFDSVPAHHAPRKVCASAPNQFHPFDEPLPLLLFPDPVPPENFMRWDASSSESLLASI